MKLKMEYWNAIVLLSVTCPDCNGAKIVVHPMWKKYWLVTEGRGSYERFFHNEGWDEVPDEEIECEHCEGTGLVRKEVELMSLFDDDEPQEEPNLYQEYRQTYFGGGE